MQPRTSQLREDFALDRDLAAGGNHLKYLGLKQVCPGVNQLRPLLARRRLLLEADNRVAVQLRHAVAARVVDLPQRQRPERAGHAMLLLHRLDVERRDDVAVEDQRSSRDVLAAVAHRAPGPERLCLGHGNDFASAIDCGEMCRNRVGLVMHRQRDFRDALGQAAHQPLEHRHVGER